MTTAPTHHGHEVYSESVLKKYDLIVLTISNSWIWKCPTRRILEWHQQRVTGNHLDVGVGTGYYLANTSFPVDSLRLGLMDLSENCLNYARQRIPHLHPEMHQQDLLQPIESPPAPFDSISLNYVFHCLPGTMAEKACVLDHLLPVLNPGGTIYGSTILSEGVPVGWLAKRLMGAYNRKQIFSNQQDTLDSLTHELNSRFEDVEIEIVGCVALFSGKKDG